MKKFLIPVLAVLLTTACSKKEDVVIIHTDYGDIRIIIDESLSDWDIIVE